MHVLCRLAFTLCPDRGFVIRAFAFLFVSGLMLGHSTEIALFGRSAVMTAWQE